jgi:hypothetical protein
MAIPWGCRSIWERSGRADETSEGFAQLAYRMIKLGSLVTEQRLVVFRH